MNIINKKNLYILVSIISFFLFTLVIIICISRHDPLEKTNKIIEERNPQTISILEPITISFGKKDSRVVTKNFLDPENNGRWAEGKISAFKVKINPLISDIILKITGVPFFGKNFKEQDIDIYANGDFIETWHFDSTTPLPSFILINIPKTKIINNELEITFIVDNPKTPKDLGVNQDERLIGFAIQEITFYMDNISGIEEPKNLKSTEIHFELLTNKVKHEVPVNIFIDGEEIKPLMIGQGNDLKFQIAKSGTEALIIIKANENCRNCSLDFSIMIPKDLQSEKIVKFTKISENNLNIAIPESPIYISNYEPYWISKINLSSGKEERIYLEWSEMIIRSK